MQSQPFYPQYQNYDPTEKRISAQEYLHSHQAGALVPLSQASITGLFVGLIVLTALVWRKVADAPVISLLVFLSVAFLTWLFLQRHWFTLTNVEKLTGLDIDRDGRVGDVPRHKIKVDMSQEHDNGFTSIKTAELPVTEREMSIMAEGLLKGSSLAEKDWTGLGKPFSIAQYRAIRVEMLGRGIIELSNPKEPRQGYKLTRSGRAVMQYFAALSPAPLSENVLQPAEIA